MVWQGGWLNPYEDVRGQWVETGLEGGENRQAGWSNRKNKRGGEMAERLGSRAINQKVAGSIPGRAR